MTTVSSEMDVGKDVGRYLRIDESYFLFVRIRGATMYVDISHDEGLYEAATLRGPAVATDGVVG